MVEKMRKSEVGMTLTDRGAYRGIYFNSVFLICYVVHLSFYVQVNFYA